MLKITPLKNKILQAGAEFPCLLVENRNQTELDQMGCRFLGSDWWKEDGLNSAMTTLQTVAKDDYNNLTNINLNYYISINHF